MIPIIGTSITRFGDLWNSSIGDLIEEVGVKAIKDSKIKAEDIDICYIANCFSSKSCGTEQLSSVVSEKLGIKNSVVVKGDISGSIAIQQAAISIISEKSKIAIVIGAEKLSDLKFDEVTCLTKELINGNEARNGSNLFANWAIISNSFSEEFNIKNSDMNIIPIINHRNAKENQFAQFRSEISSEKIESSPYISEPLRLMGCASLCDGAAAIVMCSSDAAKSHNPIGFFVSGNSSFDSASLSGRKDLLHFECAKDAFEKSLSEAKIKKEQVKIIEAHDICAVSEILSIQSMGFVKSNAIDFIKSNEHMINKSGGLKACGHAIGASGIRHAIDVISRLKKNEFGVSQSLSGSAEGCAVNIYRGSNA